LVPNKKKMNTKVARVVMWTGIACLTVQFLAAGVSKMAGAWASRFSDWGYSMAFMYVIGALEIIGVAGLFFSKTRKWSAAILILIMVGAAITHVLSSEHVRLIHNGVVAGLSFLVIYFDRRTRTAT
jgi:putative oxidoreductase